MYTNNIIQWYYQKNHWNNYWPRNIKSESWWDFKLFCERYIMYHLLLQLCRPFMHYLFEC